NNLSTAPFYTLSLHDALPILFDDQLIIDGGDLTLRLFATPGHQPDHIAILIPEINLLLAGDAAESPFPFAESAAAMPQLRASLEIGRASCRERVEGSVVVGAL